MLINAPAGALYVRHCYEKTAAGLLTINSKYAIVGAGWTSCTLAHSYRRVATPVLSYFSVELLWATVRKSSVRENGKAEKLSNRDSAN